MDEDSSLILTIRNVGTRPKSIKYRETQVEKPAFVMKKVIVAHIIIYPISLMYVALFYTLFIMGYRKCHYVGFNMILFGFIMADLTFIVAGMINFVSMFNRIIKLFDWALGLLTFSILSKCVSFIFFVKNSKECFKKIEFLKKISGISLIFLIGYWIFLYYLFKRIRKKPWKDIFLGQYK